MRAEIIRSDNFNTTAWAGGTTEQIYIYPPGSSYKDREFLFRLSCATVNAEESVFTKLPGVNRILLLLEGALRLSHGDGHPEKVLLPGMQQSFSGDLETVSHGKGRDFNLMTRENVSGSLTHTTLFPKFQVRFSQKGKEEKLSFFVLFAVDGEARLTIGGQNLILRIGECAIFQWEAEEKGRVVSVYNDGEDKIHFVAAKIRL